jgi:transcription termination factor Rho
LTVADIGGRAGLRTGGLPPPTPYISDNRPMAHGPSTHGRAQHGRGNAHNHRDGGNRRGGSGGNRRANDGQRSGHGNHPRRGNHGRPQQRRHGSQGQQRAGGYHADAPRQQPADAAYDAPLNGHVEGLLYQENERQDGILRDPAHPLRPAKGNIIVPRQLIRDLNLRPGLLLAGQPRGRTLGKVDTIEGGTIDAYLDTHPIYDATALDPAPQLRLEHNPAELTTRVMDILAPVGFGQRGLIVAPPRSGKTILLQNIARGIAHNYPSALLWLLLVDERPEEVTDMKRNVPGTVYASSNDNTIEKHLDLSQLVIERAKRLVEYGKDVIILLDSLTRLGRAFNAGGAGGGRTMTGGLDNRALEIPKKLFGAARKLEGGGSLTILATCLVDTGSKMDQIIFEEFKGTGNMELTLDRKLAEHRIFPAIDIASSGTRKEEKLMDDRSLAAARNIRRHLMNMPPTQAVKTLLDVLSKQKTNQDVYSSIRVG